MEMITADKYSKYFHLDLEEKFDPIHHIVDETLTRLDEFEALLIILQEQRCNSLGLTGSLTDALDSFGNLKEVCNRIDSLEKLIEHVKLNVDDAEKKITTIEEQCGINENSFKIKNLIKPLFQKKIVKDTSNRSDAQIFSTTNYFQSQENVE